ncbi:MAG: site-specific integrase [Thermodesulfobacteriota bacterium]
MGVYRRKDKEGKYYGPYIIQYYHRRDPITGKAIRTSLKVNGSKRLATRVYQQKLVEWEKKKHLGVEVKKEYTFGGLLKWYLNHPQAKRKKTYLRIIEMGNILEKHFGLWPAREIKPTEIEAFQDKMLNTPSKRGTPYKPATVNRFVTVIKRVYNLAIRDDMVEKNPCWKVPYLPERNARDRIVSPEEFEILKNEIPQYALILSLGYYLGMREGEILNLREKQIHFNTDGADEGHIELYDGETKSGDGRKISFSSAIGKLLKDRLAQKKRGLERFVFTTKNGNLLGNFRRAFQRACKRAEIDGLCFHDFRHTAVTNMRKAGVDTSVIMAISGHKTVAMFKRYNRIDLDDGRDAIRRLEAYLLENQEQEEEKLTSC